MDSDRGRGTVIGHSSQTRKLIKIIAGTLEKARDLPATGGMNAARHHRITQLQQFILQVLEKIWG